MDDDSKLVNNVLHGLALLAIMYFCYMQGVSDGIEDSIYAVHDVADTCSEMMDDIDAELKKLQEQLIRRDLWRVPNEETT